MPDVIHIFCDESCHLENDGSPVMGFGAVRCGADRRRELATALMALKEKHRAMGELKWEKVSPSRLSFYHELIDWFFAEPSLRFRGWLVDHKERLAHGFFNGGGHDEFYYKMFYYLLEPLIKWPQPGEQDRSFRIFLDVKDTRSRVKVAKLQEVLRNKKHDWDGTLIERVQSTHADEVQLMQLTDFFLGAFTYNNRPQVQQSEAKKACVKHIEKRAGFQLKGGTPPWEEKFNFYTFTPKEIER